MHASLTLKSFNLTWIIMNTKMEYPDHIKVQTYWSVVIADFTEDWRMIIDNRFFMKGVRFFLVHAQSD